jgi:hypothetical protein
MKPKIDLIVSINVHEKPEYFQTQIININDHIKVEKKIILNVNEYMHNELIQKEFHDTIVNPTIINKRTYHGSLTHGIISNMKLALEQFDFEYFLVMSSREFFYNPLNDVNEIKNHEDFLGQPISKRKDYNTNEWVFPKFRRDTKFFKFIEKNEMYFSNSAHEGVCFTKETCEYIVSFMSENPEIETDTYTAENCLEEFVCQSLAINSKTGTFYYIGNGCCGEPINPNKLTLKKGR